MKKKGGFRRFFFEDGGAAREAEAAIRAPHRGSVRGPPKPGSLLAPARRRKSGLKT